MIQHTKRLESIDTLRGLVMVLMALDHTRDFWGLTSFDPTDPAESTLSWFAIRWITHFCAPVFVLLTGISAYLYGSKGRSKTQLSLYLATRGLWLVFLEVTLVNFFWRFDVGSFLFLAVIAAIGWSLILLSGLIWLPRPMIVVFAFITIVSHNLFDAVDGETFGRLDWVWYFLHEPNYKQITNGMGIAFSYPLIPWCGVMAFGYGIGPLMLDTPDTRRRWLLRIGIAMSCLFVILRTPNLYGDPHTWSVGSTGMSHTLMSFLRITKYPPSLQFLCATLGPSLLLLCWMESWHGRISRFFRVFGQVPLFFYLIHIPVIRLSGSIKNHLVYGVNIDPFGSTDWPDNYQPKLWLVLIAFAVLIAALYPLCRWFGKIKQQRRSGWLRWL